jgi:L-fuculose-phosphate aldolase
LLALVGIGYDAPTFSKDLSVLTVPQLRRDLVATAQKMSVLGLSPGTSGNVSCRTPRGFLITPSGLPYELMRSDDVVEMNASGHTRAFIEPSTEWRMHQAVYAARAEVEAVVHTHSMFATTLACANRAIPAFHYMVAIAGGEDIRCAPYATFGSEALAQSAVAALCGRRACLLARHGLLAVGRDLHDALHLASQVEILAEQYWRALQMGEVEILDSEEMKRVLEKFSTYGAGALRHAARAYARDRD